MNSIIGSLIVGIIAGLIDAVPMILKKMDKTASFSAFFQYVVVSFVVAHIDVPGISWWIEGPLVSLLMIIPVIIIVGKSDKKSIPIITINAIILGLLISLGIHYLIKTEIII